MKKRMNEMENKCDIEKKSKGASNVHNVLDTSKPSSLEAAQSSVGRLGEEPVALQVKQNSTKDNQKICVLVIFAFLQSSPVFFANLSFVIVNQTQGTTDSSLKASLPILSDTPEMGEREESRGEVSSNGDGVCVLTSTSASMEAAAVVVVVAVVFLHLIVVNWSGDEIARLEVRPSDTVLVGMRQVEDQLGVPVARQMLVCYEDLLEAGQVWSSYSSVRDWSTIQLTTVGQTFDAASDREALMVLFESCCGGATSKWRPNFNWGSAKPLSDWDGVKLDQEGRVKSVNVSQSGLEGTIPPEIGNLTALSCINLNGNFLTGCIPSELSQLTVLRELWLGGCKPNQLAIGCNSSLDLSSNSS